MLMNLSNMPSPGVVHRLAQALVLVGGHADNMEDKRALGFRAHDSIEGR
jgi:hypothetical protein